MEMKFREGEETRKRSLVIFFKTFFYDRGEDGARGKGRGFLIMIKNCLGASRHSRPARTEAIIILYELKPTLSKNQYPMTEVTCWNFLGVHRRV